MLLILLTLCTSRYLDDILNINKVYFDNMVSQIYPSELNKKKLLTEHHLEFLSLKGG